MPEKLIEFENYKYGYHECSKIERTFQNEDYIPLWQDNKWYIGCEGRLSQPITYCPHCGVNLTE